MLKPLVLEAGYLARPSGGERMRRYYLYSLVVAIIAAALATPAAAQDKPRYGGELIFAVPSEPPSYDAHREETFGVIHPLPPHYNTLLRPDPTDPKAAGTVGELPRPGQP